MEYGNFVWLLVGECFVGGQISEILGQFKLWSLETVSLWGKGGVLSPSRNQVSFSISLDDFV